MGGGTADGTRPTKAEELAEEYTDSKRLYRWLGIFFGISAGVLFLLVKRIPIANLVPVVPAVFSIVCFIFFLSVKKKLKRLNQ